MISTFFSFYVGCLTSWWWIAVAMITLVYITACNLKDDDDTLSTLKAWQLSCIGLVALIPWVKNLVPFKLEMDFETRWAVLGMNSFIYFVITIVILSFLFGPLAFAFVFFDRYIRSWKETAFACDIKSHGLMQALKWKLRLDK